MRSARLLLGIFRRHRLQEHGVNSAFEAAQSNYSHAQVSHNNAISDYFSVYSTETQGLQRNVSYALSEPVGNCAVYEYEGGVSASNSGGLALNCGNNFGCGFVAHYGSSRHFKWDAREGCMLPFAPSNPFFTRLSLSIKAFVRAWRMS